MTGTALTCSASGSDPDDGTLAPTYSWTVNGSNVGSGSTYTVSASDTNVGDQIVCTATVTDSDGQSATGNANVTVQNSAPTIASGPTLSLEWSWPITCSGSGADVDADSVSLAYVWTDNSGNNLGTGALCGVKFVCWGDDNLHSDPIRWYDIRCRSDL